MEWYHILGVILGAFGGVSGIISLYTAKSNKDTIDIKNLHSIIEDERKERESLTKEYYQYRQFVDEKVASVKRDFEELKAENKKMVKAIYQAYRCKLPETLHDCPVIKSFEDSCRCDECNSHLEE
jgi:hypothetical protein